METRYLDVPGGRLAYDLYDTTGTGPLVICAPGMGDLRQEYRLLAPRLAAAGFRVATLDVRGHGETSVGWNDYSVAGVGADMLALARALGGGPAMLAGTSMAGGAAVWAAAEAPHEVAGIVLIDPFTRAADGPAWQTRLQHLFFGTLFARPWGPALWLRYYTSLYPTARPADFAAYRQQLGANLRQRGRFEALRQMLFASKAASDARLGSVQAPTLILMGSKDPDFKDPAGEAHIVAERLQATRATVRMIAGAGHYPHAEMPERTAAEIITFLQSIGSPQETMAHGA